MISPSTFEYRPQEQEEAGGGGENQQSPSPAPKFIAYPSSSQQPRANPWDGVGVVKGNAPVLPARSSGAPKPAPAYKSKRTFKTIIIGDAGVGKTSLSFRFCNGRFPAHTEATIGVDFRERSIVIDEELIRVQLWDTAGQERYRQSIVSHYYRNVNAVVFVYAVNDESSFKSLPAWIKECQKHSLTPNDDTPHILIGNKCDLTSPSAVKTSEAQRFADENDMALFETSALADSEADHVEAIFLTLVHKLRLSKAMHVQSTDERASNQQRLLLKANEAGQLEQAEGWCC